MKKSIGRLMSILHRQAQIYINQALREYNISAGEHFFLLYLFNKNGATQDEMSTFLYIDKSATARSIKSLEEKCYITRDKDDSDKRFNRVFLTDKALSNMEDIRKRIWHWSEFLTEDLDSESKELIYTILESMVYKVEHADFKKVLEDM